MIAIGSDHAGYALKCEMIKHLEEKGVEFIDCGCNGESVDYPDIAEKTCEKVTSGEADKAILICGTGVGISISANKIKGIRTALCGDWYSRSTPACTTTRTCCAWAAELSVQVLRLRSWTCSLILNLRADVMRAALKRS